MRRVTLDGDAAVEYRDIPEVAKRRMPKQKPGKSEQIVVTPWELVDAVEARFGKLRFDLAATRENCRVRSDPSRFYGPGSSRGTNSLKKDWSKRKGLCWLNCEYADISPWAQKCAETPADPKRGILLLVRASVGANWWSEFVDRRCEVHFLSPRVTFEEHVHAYPADLALCHYNGLGTHGYECWRWRK